MASRPNLSIAIPTYNRAATLREQLWNVCSQVQMGGLTWQVVVSDNASTDDTTAVVEQLRSRFDNIKYARNSQNIGLLLNIDAAVRAADGAYVWLLGDDDIVMPFAIQTLANFLARPELEAGTVALACINAFAMTHDGEAIVYASDRDCALPTTVFKDGGELFEQVGYESLGHISRLIVNRAMWMLHDYNQREPWEVYSFIRTLILMALKAPTAWIGTPIIGARNKHSVSYYTNHLAPAHTIEFRHFDLLLGRKARPCNPAFKRRYRLTKCRMILKIAVFDQEYGGLFSRIPVHYLFGAERIVYWLAKRFVRGKWSGRLLRREWMKRMRFPIEQDRSLLHSV